MHQQALKRGRCQIGKLGPTVQVWYHHLHLYDPCAKNGFYIFWLKKIKIQDICENETHV